MGEPVQYSGTLPSENFAGVSVNLQDGSGGPIWTPGDQLTVAIPTGLSIAEELTLSGWGFTCVGWKSNNLAPASGKLGKLIAGPIVGYAPLAQQGKTGAFQPIPPEALPYVQTVWDGDNDPAFPEIRTGGGLSVVTGFQGGTLAVSSQFPQPLKLSSGVQIGFGVWLTPSLISTGNLALGIMQGVYTLF